eukprot:TRINITY_DN30698_c0_g1_i1.p1 TRINITY_DN30698_c0_g1~~TRINITY_DN30698_c0_g1_i1.p1  ORF type:complete len:370 (-),score=51.51 TRINITY_DN30698_c0_g1_i1:84-1193(-)
MADSKIGVGILGCANIARKNARAVLRTSNAELRAVASRSIGKCKTWCDALHLPDTVDRLGSYEALLARQDVQIVYAPLPTTAHAEWVPKIAAAGKHIIIEKPVGRTAEEVAEMIRCCRDKGVQFMDGTMFWHHERFGKMRRLFDDKLLWDPLRVTSAFSFVGSQEFLGGSDIRTRADGDPLGCLGDLGWYCIRIGLAAFRCQEPVAVSARTSAATSAGVPLEMDVTVFFDVATQPGETPTPRRLLSFHCSFLAPFRQWFEAVSRESKIVRCDDFVIPRREDECYFELEDVDGLKDFDTLVAGAKASISTSDCTQEVMMFEKMAGLVSAGRTEREYEDIAILVHRVMDAAMASAGAGGGEVNLASVSISA